MAGRSYLPLADFCRASGASGEEVTALILSGDLDGLLDRADRAVGVFDDPLPSAARLVELGVRARDDYEPSSLQSFEP